MNPQNEGPGGAINARPARTEDDLRTPSLPRTSRRHGPFPDRSLRAFAGWPEGLACYLETTGTEARS